MCLQRQTFIGVWLTNVEERVAAVVQAWCAVSAHGGSGKESEDKGNSEGLHDV
jgi:hypothetical protein